MKFLFSRAVWSQKYELLFEAFSFVCSSNYLIVAKDLVPTLEAKWGVKLVSKGEVKGAQLEGSTYRHPLFERESPVVIGGDYITTESGTGLVHTAPGHGQEVRLSHLFL